MNWFRKKKKIGDSRKPAETMLLSDQYMTYNGVRIHWFIGDFNDTRGYWEAWGSCNDMAGKLRAYQMFAWFDQGRGGSGVKQKKNLRRLFDIKVLNNPASPYHHPETFKRLTA
jgi:hypothetical protein